MNDKKKIAQNYWLRTFAKYVVNHLILISIYNIQDL